MFELIFCVMNVMVMFDILDREVGFLNHDGEEGK